MTFPASTGGELAAGLSQLGAAPALTIYTDERLELAGNVVLNWLNKTANYLQNEIGALPEDKLGLALPWHWRSFIWANAAVLSGMEVADFLNGEYLGAGTAPAPLAELEYALVVGEKYADIAGYEADSKALLDLHFLALRYRGELYDSEDANAAVLGQADSLIGSYFPHKQLSLYQTAPGNGLKVTAAQASGSLMSSCPEKNQELKASSLPAENNIEAARGLDAETGPASTSAELATAESAAPAPESNPASENSPAPESNPASARGLDAELKPGENPQIYRYFSENSLINLQDEMSVKFSTYLADFLSEAKQDERPDLANTFPNDSGFYLKEASGIPPKRILLITKKMSPLFTALLLAEFWKQGIEVSLLRVESQGSSVNTETENLGEMGESLARRINQIVTQGKINQIYWEK